MKGFIERQNIAHYVDQLKTECDPVWRDMLLKLLAKEEVKRVKTAPLIRLATRIRHAH